MSLLELKERQEIVIEKKKYEVLNMTKFREKSSYWVEYLSIEKWKNETEVGFGKKISLSDIKY